MIVGLGVVVLIPLVALGGVAALLVAAVATLGRATRRRPSRQGFTPMLGLDLPRPARLRTAPAQLRGILAARRAA